MNYVLVTGVSTGIGKAIALDLLKNDYFVIGTVRKKEDSRILEEEYPNNFAHILLDLEFEKSINRAYNDAIKIIGNNYLTGLINNSGIALGAPLLHQDMNDIRKQFEVNFFGLLSFTQKLLPHLGAEWPQKQKPGKIMNISSTNGKITYPFIGAYSATKHALEALSDALRYELNIYDIKVVSIEPGSINTEIWDKAEETDLSPYENTDYGDIIENFKDEMVKLGRKGLLPESVAQVVRKALESANPKTRYVISNNLISEWILPYYLPDKLFDKLVTKEVGLIKKKNS